MGYKTLEYEIPEEGIGILSLNRPRLFDRVDDEMMAELEASWGERLCDLEQAFNLEDRNQALLVARARLGEGDKTGGFF